MLPLVSRASVGAVRNATKCIVPFRTSIVSGPPRTRVPFAEKVILGGGMCISICILPAYILCNMKNYTAGQ